MIDAVLSYHMNPDTCGVAKFNALLAQKLGVPMLPLMPWPKKSECPLVSVKALEMTESDREWLRDSVAPESGIACFEVFWHDAGIDFVTRRARRVFDAHVVGCPSTIVGTAARGAYRVLTFGMSHKMLSPHFTQLKHRLDAEHADYTVEVSSAQHEGFDGSSNAANIEALRGIFGDKLRVLGFLADDALAKELHDVDAVALYYHPALRANNTTAWAALEAGKTLYTNTDADSPALDVTAHSWDKLLELIRA